MTKKNRGAAAAQQPDPLLGRRVRINDDARVKPGQTGTIIRVTAARQDGVGEYEVDFGGEGSTFYYAMNEFTVQLDAADAAQLPPGRFENADPHLVAFSLNNPRKRKGLDIDSLNALAASIKAQGLAQPILVRPLPGSRTEDTFTDREPGKPLPVYELVCGERRLRATRLAGLDTIPMLVRDLTDEQALELQLVENIEREDLDPMEEAEGFALLKEKLGYTVEQIAERIGRGKGKWYVYKTMKLLQLTPESREALYDGHLGRSTALLVASYPADQQKEVVDFIKSQAGEGSAPMPYDEIQPLVRHRFNLVLKLAVWPLDDAELVVSAGACTTCQKRTGAQAEIFGDANPEDSCTDAACFDGKRQALVERLKAQAAKDGFKVLDEAETRNAVMNPHSEHSPLRGYVRLSDFAYTEKGNDDVERQVTFEDALRKLGKKAPKPRVLVNAKHGTAEKVITSELAEKLLPAEEKGRPHNQQQPQAAAGRPAAVVKEAGGTHPVPADERPDEHKAIADPTVRRAVIRRAFDNIRRCQRDDKDLRLIAKWVFGLVNSNWGPVGELEQYLGWAEELEDLDDDEVERIVFERIDAMPGPQLGDFLVMMAFELAIASNAHSNQAAAVKLADDYGVDVLAIRDKVAEDLAKQDAGEEEPEEEGAEA